MSGRGHIRRQGKNSWGGKYEKGVDPVTKERRTGYFTVKGTKREAQAELTRLLGEVSRGVLVDHSKETVGAFLERWLRDWACLNVSSKTFERWVQLATIQIVPRLGSAPIQRIKPVDLTTLYATLMREGGARGGPLAPRTAGHCHRLLCRAFGHALEWGLIQSNPAAVAQPPRVPDVEIEIPTEDELAAVLEHVKPRNPQLHALGAVDLVTGARRGELCAFLWRHFDAKAGTLKIERSLETTKAGLRFKSPKSKTGKRTLSLPVSAVEVLRAHWRTQQETRLKLGLGRAGPDDLIFAKADGSPLEPDTVSKEWLRATKAATGRPIGLHSLRHHHASHLIAHGCDILTVSRRLGHASPTITLNVYGHLYPQTDDKALTATESLFARVSRPSQDGERS
jgi:integrase